MLILILIVLIVYLILDDIIDHALMSLQVANEGHHKRKRDQITQGNSGLVAGSGARAEAGADAGVSPSTKQNES